MYFVGHFSTKNKLPRDLMAKFGPIVPIFGYDQWVWDTLYFNSPLDMIV